jgi:hypothetical protein
MKKSYLIVITIFVFAFGHTNAQVGIGNVNPDASSILDVTSPDKGILVPRMDLSTRNSISSPAEGLLIYNTTDLGFNYYQSGWKDFSAGYNVVSATSPITTYLSSDTVVPGMSFSPKAGNYLAQFNAQYIINAVSVTAQGVVDLNTNINTLMGLGKGTSSLAGYTTTSSHALAFANGDVVTPGIYQIDGAGSIAGTITLDGGGNANALFVFKITGAFNTGASVQVQLSNAASAANVFWISDGAIGLGAGTIMKGTMISRGSAIAIGAGCNVEGRMLTTSGAIGFGPGTATVPAGSSLVDLGILNSFCMYTTAGSIGNTGASYVTGNIGTNSGAITTFGPKAPNSDANGYVDGSKFLPENNSSTATFSIYQNGVLIPSSLRTRTSTLDTIDINLQTVASTLVAGQPIEVRWSVDFGSLILKNRTFSILNLR